MSGIYIPGMKLPKSCSGCVFERWENGYGDYCAICPNPRDANDQIERRDTDRMPWCPLVPVPEHGRLGDLEQAVIILDRTRDHCGNEDMAFALNWAANSVRGLPTVIPAEEGEV